MRLTANPVKVPPLKNWHTCAENGRNTGGCFLRQSQSMFIANDSHIKLLKLFTPNPERAAEGFYFCGPKRK